MSLILSLDTSDEYCSVAIHLEGRCLAQLTIHEKHAHAAKLATISSKMLSALNIEWTDLKAVAVSAGPGSYTGLRIGASFAKGICFALQVPLISVISLEVMIRQVMNHYNGKDVLYCPMIDARRMEVYTMVADSQGQILEAVQPMVLDAFSFNKYLQNKSILFFGSGAQKLRQLLNERTAIFLDRVHPTAEAVGMLAYEKFKTKAFENLAAFEPFYLKEFYTSVRINEQPELG